MKVRENTGHRPPLLPSLSLSLSLSLSPSCLYRLKSTSHNNDQHTSLHQPAEGFSPSCLYGPRPLHTTPHHAGRHTSLSLSTSKHKVSMEVREKTLPPPPHPTLHPVSMGPRPLHATLVDRRLSLSLCLH